MKKKELENLHTLCTFFTTEIRRLKEENKRLNSTIGILDRQYVKCLKRECDAITSLKKLRLFLLLLEEGKITASMLTVSDCIEYISEEIESIGRLLDVDLSPDESANLETKLKEKLHFKQWSLIRASKSVSSSESCKYCHTPADDPSFLEMCSKFFKCLKCEEVVPWCYGCGDDTPDLCDSCSSEYWGK
tara:strand:+ start:190 stop:756 length:567 start_codon:yes stop_codon:yes gene_type:complete